MSSISVKVGYYISPTNKGSFVVQCFLPNTKRYVKYPLPNVGSMVMVAGTLIGTMETTYEPAILIEDIHRLSSGSYSLPPSQSPAKGGMPATPKGKWDFSSPSIAASSSSRVRTTPLKRTIHETEGGAAISPSPAPKARPTRPPKFEMVTRRGGARGGKGKQKDPELYDDAPGSPSGQLHEEENMSP